MSNSHLRCLGIDPANRAGFAHSSGISGVWQIGGHPDEHRGARLARLLEYIRGIGKQFGIDVIAFEDAGFGSRNPAIQALHNECRGIIVMAAHEFNARVMSWQPNIIKLFATGSGAADKQQMKAACERILGKVPQDDNEADALWILEMAKQGYVHVPKSRKPKEPKAKKNPQQGKFRFRRVGR